MWQDRLPILKTKEEHFKSKEKGTYDYHRDYPYVCDVDLLRSYIKKKGYRDSINAIRNALDCGIAKSKFLSAKGLYTLHETKKLAKAFNMPFWDFYEIFLRDVYTIEYQDVNFIKLKDEFASDNQLTFNFETK